MAKQSSAVALHRPPLSRRIALELRRNWLLFVMLLPAVVYVCIFSY